MSKKILVLFLGLLFQVSVAQENVTSSGKSSQSASGKSAYSVGLIHYKPSEGPGGSSSTGSQVSFEVLTSLSLDTEELISLNIFPNPTSDYIMINLREMSQLSYQIYDITGKQLLKGKIENTDTKINLKPITSSICILNIYKDNTLFESHKIIKK
ncbi:MAG: T9SS C-terminal target domain-containing protein [Winogradskyella sp.]|uniref:T9SS type A sorting domain-containing protein n=1 Tax=Winogradskyella sp. TaxID=1883156 RepID=UPI000F3D315C|nr:T9SS type A sorting domain-containing protein [Winogradskyella sp.]RNC88052.1 MAG: T9SS C-terminal target domain-containing protein [Winogradskyella sp.]